MTGVGGGEQVDPTRSSKPAPVSWVAARWRSAASVQSTELVVRMWSTPVRRAIDSNQVRAEDRDRGPDRLVTPWVCGFGASTAAR